MTEETKTKMEQLLTAKVYDLYEIFVANILNSYEDASETQLVADNLDRKIHNPEAGGDITDEFKALLYAMFAIYKIRTNDENTDLIGFIHIMNMLAHETSNIAYENQIKDLQDYIKSLEESEQTE